MATFVHAQDSNFKSILQQIDEAIEASPQTVAAYEQQINDVRQKYRQAQQPDEKYAQAFKLYELNNEPPQ